MISTATLYTLGDIPGVVPGAKLGTIQFWVRSGKLVPLRTHGRQMLFTEEHLQQIRAMVAGKSSRQAGRPTRRTAVGQVTALTADDLTPRERQVLALVCDGHSSKQVAAELGLSVKTVECHRVNLMGRAGIRDLAGLVKFAIRTGITQL